MRRFLLYVTASNEYWGWVINMRDLNVGEVLNINEYSWS